MTGCSLDDARRIALDVHRHQVDKLGVPYMGDVERVLRRANPALLTEL